jgi:glycosyltransferase involved in cell wall biosynthesis
MKNPLLSKMLFKLRLLLAWLWSFTAYPIGWLCIKTLHDHRKNPQARMTALILTRNSEAYINTLVEYYITLGVEHVMVMDNGSTDGTVEKLKAYEGVTVFGCRLPFKYFEYQMKQWLVIKGRGDGWCLCLDDDEYFTYPHQETVTLPALLDYLDARGYKEMWCQMVDMFPSTDEAPIGRDFLNTHKTYSAEYFIKESYPSLAEKGIYGLRKGLRGEVFGVEDLYLSKVPLFRNDKKLRRYLITTHVMPAPLGAADVSGAVLHYKFYPGCEAYVKEMYESGKHFKHSRDYKALYEALVTNPEPQTFFKEVREKYKTKQLTNTDMLVEDGVMVVSDAYKARRR